MTATPAIDWDAVTAEAVSYLTELIRIDTTNPPGQEEGAARFLAGILEREGFSVRLIEPAPGRLNLWACLLGDGSKGALCLLNHTDVVPAEAEFWEEDPLGGVVKDGVIWGRGALDMKNVGVMQLLMLLLAKRHRLPLKRDLHFLAVADEEAGSEHGIEYISREHPELMEVEFVLNEGAYGVTRYMGRRRPVFEFATTEKTPLWLRLTAEGRPGHGSVPHANNSADRLVRALARIAGWRREIRVVPAMREYLGRLEQLGMLPRFETEGHLAAFAENNPGLMARLSDTVSLTSLSGGVTVNVIPASASATLDCRLLPGQSHEAFLRDLRDVVDDDQVKVTVISRYEASESPLDTELFRTVQDVTGEMVEGSVVLPQMAAGFTDSRAFRLRGVKAYGFVPCLLDPVDYAGIHGHNERISVENLRLGTQILWEVVRRLCL